MPVSFDPADDLSICDALEAVTLRSARGGPAAAVPAALRRRLQRSEAEPSAGQGVAEDVVWHLPAAALVAPPAVGDVLTDSRGARYVLQAIDHATLGTRLACRCRNLAVVGNLDRRVELQQATWIKSLSGVPIATWHTVRIDLPARIQPHQADVTFAYDRQLTRITHRILLADDVAIDHAHRIVDGDTSYRVLGYERPERIDALFVILAAQVLTGS